MKKTALAALIAVASTFTVVPAAHAAKTTDKCVTRAEYTPVERKMPWNSTKADVAAAWGPYGRLTYNVPLVEYPAPVTYKYPLCGVPIRDGYAFVGFNMTHTRIKYIGLHLSADGSDVWH